MFILILLLIIVLTCISQDFEKTEYHSVFELNLDNLSVGSYHYKFELVSQTITNGSFVISK